VSNNQFGCEVDAAEEILFQSEVLKTDRTDILVEDESSLDILVHQHGIFSAELVRKNLDPVEDQHARRAEAISSPMKEDESNYRISGSL